MSTSLPSQDEQSTNVTHTEEESQTAMPSQASASQPVVLPSQPENEAEESFYFEEEQPDLGPAFIAPFQISGAMPTMPAQPFSQSSAMPTKTTPAPAFSQPSSALPPTPAAPTTKTKRRPRLSLTMVAIIVCLIVVVGLLVINALGQTTPPLQTRGNGSTQTTQQVTQKPTTKTGRPTPVPTATQANGTNGQTPGQAASAWVPQQLPHGWINAGLSTADAIQAIRTAVTFNDREMSLDFRSVGTRNNHGGTFTAATFVMTAAARQRFFQNDVRESSNALFDTVVNNQQIRLVVNPQPQLVNFAQVGQQQFAWVDVAFQYWQSQIDPNNPQQRIGGLELDPATHQPRIHHMMVLLLFVPAANEGNNPAMGGTGWLVSNYGLDLPHGTNLDIVQPA
jgi:hypothetical protein